MTVGLVADDDTAEEIEVTILLEDLVPACRPLRGLRTNHGDQRLTVRWAAAPETAGRARVLGYETEIRRGDTGPWTGQRTIFGRNIESTVYTRLENGEGYQVRVRPITAEGDCDWSPRSGASPPASSPLAIPPTGSGTSPSVTPSGIGGY